jgi:hypothetical protein
MKLSKRLSMFAIALSLLLTPFATAQPVGAQNGFCNGLPVTGLVGTPGNDVIEGTPNADVING